MEKQKDTEDGIQNNKREIENFISRGYEEIDFYSLQLSTVLRQLAFAEGAVFWFCKEQFDSSIILLGIGFAFLLLYFVFDAKQYLSGMHHYKKQTEKYYDDFVTKKIYDVENYLDQKSPNLTGLFFYLKISMICSSSFILIIAFILGISCPISS